MSLPAPDVTTIPIDLVIDRLNVKDVLSGVLHAILFHRLFGLLKPKTFEVLGVTMPGVSDKEMEDLVTDKVDAFWKAMENGSNKRGQIVVSISERKKKQGWFVYPGEEDVPWEHWVINAELRQPRDRERQSFDDALSAGLTKALMTMATQTSTKSSRERVPPITNATAITPFPISIAVKVGGTEVG